MSLREEIMQENIRTDRAAIVPEYRRDTFHARCGSHGSDLMKTSDGSRWEICSKCGVEIREITAIDHFADVFREMLP
jgi:hypothetical protein